MENTNLPMDPCLVLWSGSANGSRLQSRQNNPLHTEPWAARFSEINIVRRGPVHGDVIWLQTMTEMKVSGVMRLPPDSQPRTKGFRFKLRTLFIIVFVSAVATWWIMVPTQKVNWFATEVNNGESDVAMAVVKPFAKDESWHRSLVRHLANGKQVKAVESKTEVIVFGERRFTVVQGHDVETVDSSRQYGYSTAKGAMTRWGIRQN